MKTCKVAKWSLLAGILSFAIPLLLGLLAFIISSRIALGIIGVYIIGAFIGFISAILAITLGLISLKDIKAQPDILTGKGFALTGIILGGLWIVLNITGVLIVITYILPKLFIR